MSENAGDLNAPLLDRGRKYVIGDLEGISQILTARLKEFFNAPLTSRLRELPVLIEHTDKKEAKKIHRKFEELAEFLDRPTIPIDISSGYAEGASLDMNRFHRFVDERIQHCIGAAFRVLLYQLLIECLLADTDEVSTSQLAMRQILGIKGVTSLDLAKELSRMFDGVMSTRLRVRPQGRPKEAELPESAKDRYSDLRGLIKKAKELGKGCRGIASWKDRLKANSFGWLLNYPDDFLERIFTEEPAVIAREILRQNLNLPVMSDEVLRKKLRKVDLAKKKKNK